MNVMWLKQLRIGSTSKTVGSLITVGLPQLGITDIDAKVDTGAFSGSLHATNIRVTKNIQGKKVLQFEPNGSNRTVTIDKYHRRTIKSSNGQTAERFAFATTISILGEEYPITISLSDRSAMKHPMLIGRKFLKTHGFLVDVSLINQ
jgi:hypothetical protein